MQKKIKSAIDLELGITPLKAKNATTTMRFIKKIITEFMVEEIIIVQRGTYIFLTSDDFVISEAMPDLVPSEKKLKSTMAVKSCNE